MTDSIKMPEFPEPDGTAEANCIQVRGSDGLVYREYEEVPAWSMPLVEELMREAVRLNAQAVPSVSSSDMVATERKRCESLARQALDAGMSGNWARAEMLMTDIKWGNYYTHIQLHPIDTLSAAPAAPQPAQQTCNCRWVGDVQVQQCTLHQAHVEAIHEWAERAKTAEAKLNAQQPLTDEKDALLRQALDALEGFANITNDSQGVKGYHLNGDIAEWDEFDEVDAASNTIEAIRNHFEVET